MHLWLCCRPSKCIAPCVTQHAVWDRRDGWDWRVGLAVWQRSRRRPSALKLYCASTTPTAPSPTAPSHHQSLDQTKHFTTPPHPHKLRAQLLPSNKHSLPTYTVLLMGLDALLQHICACVGWQQPQLGGCHHCFWPCLHIDGCARCRHVQPQCCRLQGLCEVAESVGGPPRMSYTGFRQWRGVRPQPTAAMLHF